LAAGTSSVIGPACGSTTAIGWSPGYCRHFALEPPQVASTVAKSL
jgi:hypothetical protein